MTGRPPAGQAGVWRFGPVSGTRTYDLTIAAGPYVEEWRGAGGAEGSVRMSIRRRPSLDGADGVAGLARFAETAQRALEYYERTLGVPCPYPKYDIGFVPRLSALAVSIPGLMLVNESLLARMADPDDDVVAMVCAHEVSHLWFGCHVSMRWWDDLWQDEAMATYMSYAALGDAWAAFCYREKPRAYQADALPGRQPVSSPVASAGDALLRRPALTYSKGAAVIRQLAALIGDDALRAGLADFMRRFGGGSVGLDDLIACWSRSSGRDLGGWADEWLRTEGASTLRGTLVAAADGTIGSLTVRQDEPRTHRLDIGLYDWAGSGLRRRRVISAEVSGPVSEVAVPAGETMPDALVLNDGDLSYAEIAFDPATLEALTRAAMDVGDPLTEAVCWTAAWRMVTAGSPGTGALAAADFAGLVIRRLRGSAALPVAAVEVLLERAVTAADRYAPGAERAGLRAAIASACLDGVSAAVAGSARQRALAVGFAASADTPEQHALASLWLDGGSRPDGLAFDGDLRGNLLRTLAARGLASDDDLEELVAADPVAGEQNRATCRALRPDAAAKQAAWAAALAAEADWRMAVAAARGIWVPGQEAELGRAWLAEYRDRYFTEALPALDGREVQSDAAAGPGALPGHARRAGDAGGDRGGARARRPGQPRVAAGAARAGGDPAFGAGGAVGPAAVALSYPRLPRLFLERPGVGGDVDGVGPQDLQRDDLERALVGRGQHHRGGGTVAVRLQPVGRGHAPPIPRHQPGEPELGHRRRQVVADPALMLEEFGGHHRADGVTAQVLGAGRAASVPVEAGERIGSTRLKLAAEHITVTHACSIRTGLPIRKLAPGRRTAD